MSEFIGNLDVRFVARCDNRSLWQLRSTFSFSSDLFGAVLTVPEGFVFDFASVPRLTKFIVDGDDPDIVEASAIHDYLYAMRGRIPGLPYISRKLADDVLIEGMAVRGASKLRRAAVYRAVRWFGGTNWQSL